MYKNNGIKSFEFEARWKCVELNKKYKMHDRSFVE